MHRLRIVAVFTAGVLVVAGLGYLNGWSAPVVNINHTKADTPIKSELDPPIAKTPSQEYADVGLLETEWNLFVF